MPNFSQQYKRLHRAVVISGKSQRTLTNYARCLAQMGLHLKCDLLAREQDLLNISYFHGVFTLPDHLNELALQHPKVIYQLLFKTAWQVLIDFGRNPRFLGALTGMIAVLHSWGQNLSLHAHLHCAFWWCD